MGYDRSSEAARLMAQYQKLTTRAKKLIGLDPTLPALESEKKLPLEEEVERMAQLEQGAEPHRISEVALRDLGIRPDYFKIKKRKV